MVGIHYKMMKDKIQTKGNRVWENETKKTQHEVEEWESHF